MATSITRCKEGYFKMRGQSKRKYNILIYLPPNHTVAIRKQTNKPELNGEIDKSTITAGKQEISKNI